MVNNGKKRSPNDFLENLDLSKPANTTFNVSTIVVVSKPVKIIAKEAPNTLPKLISPYVNSEKRTPPITKANIKITIFERVMISS